MKKIAIVGAGMAGLAATWHLLQKEKVSVTLFDAQGIGGGASGASTGLLHPFPGKRGLKSLYADEGMKASLALLDASEKALGRPVAQRSGILRFAITEEQKRDFREKGIQWTEEKVHQKIPKAASASGWWIPEGIAVFSKLYLEGLWKACLGANLEIMKIDSLAMLDAFDAIVLTAGAGTLPLLPKEFQKLLKCNFGQSLLCRCPEPLPFSLLSQGHITPTEDPTLCQVGSTYEHGLQPDPKKALELLEKCALFYPPAKHFEIVEIRSGIRIAPQQGYQPLVQKIGPKTWVFTGLGSRGLLYHALFSKDLVK